MHKPGRPIIRTHAPAGAGTSQNPLLPGVVTLGDFDTMTVPSHDMAISDRLAQLVTETDDDTVTLDWILEQLHERAFGLFLIILALPCCIPFLYGVPQVVALPLMFVSVQIALGRRCCYRLPISILS